MRREQCDKTDDNWQERRDAVATQEPTYHDGCYEATLKINFTEADKTLLVEYLKSL